MIMHSPLFPNVTIIFCLDSLLRGHEAVWFRLVRDKTVSTRLITKDFYTEAIHLVLLLHVASQHALGKVLFLYYYRPKDLQDSSACL